MPPVRLPIKGYPYSNVDGVELTEQPESLIDGYVNEAGTYVKRPGFALFCDLEDIAPVQGLYYWREKGVVVAVCNQNIYKITEAGAKTDITSDQLTGNNRVSFAEVVQGDASHHLAMADGGNIISWDGVGVATAQIADGDAPTSVKFVSFLDGYLLATNENNSFYWSDLNDFDSWTGSSIASAETNNDNITAIRMMFRELVLFGEQTVEIWYSTGDSDVFTRRLGAEIERGCFVPQTIQSINDVLIFFDSNRRVSMLTGRTPQVVSTSIDRELANLTVVTDAYADILQADGRGFYVLTFPTEERTFVYDFQSNGWCEWGWWDAPNNVYRHHRAKCSVYVPEWGKHLIGDRANGKVYTVDDAYYADDDVLIRMKLKTGHIDHGTFVRKRSNKLRLHTKRGVAVSDPILADGTYTADGSEEADGDAGEPTPELSIRWRDDGGPWGNESLQSLGLGYVGENKFLIDLFRLGIYRTRQYEIVQTDKVEFRLMGMEEVIDFMTS